MPTVEFQGTLQVGDFSIPDRLGDAMVGEGWANTLQVRSKASAALRIGAHATKNDEEMTKINSDIPGSKDSTNLITPMVRPWKFPATLRTMA